MVMELISLECYFINTRHTHIKRKKHYKVKYVFLKIFSKLDIGIEMAFNILHVKLVRYTTNKL
jgi:hypothetical protein